MEPVEVRSYVVEFIGVEIAVDIRGDSRPGVAHGFLDVANVSAGGPGQAAANSSRLHIAHWIAPSTLAIPASLRAPRGIDLDWRAIVEPWDECMDRSARR
jgi:hypothetical protein